MKRGLIVWTLPALLLLGALVPFISEPSEGDIGTRGDLPFASSFYASGWTFPWDEPTMVSIKPWVDVLDEVSPYWYWVLQNGTMVHTHNETEDVGLITYLHQNGIGLVPMFSNNHDSQTIRNLIHNSSMQQGHIQDILGVVQQFSYAGVDINYEDIPTAERSGYADFIGNLSAALHGINKKLYVSVFPKVAADEDREGPGGYDYKRIGGYADRVRIMAYNLHWSTAPTSGPITSRDWVGKVMDYAATAIPKYKIVLGVPQYGYDWRVTSKGNVIGVADNVSYPDVQFLMKDYNAQRRWNSTSRTPYFHYRGRDGYEHDVHYCDAESLLHQMRFVGDRGLAGISMWKIGGEDTLSSFYLKELKTTGLSNLPPYLHIEGDILGMRGQQLDFGPVRAYDLEGVLDEVAWDFGDGNYSSLLEPVYSYSRGGFYKASLTVKDDRGRAITLERKVRIGPYSVVRIEGEHLVGSVIKFNATESWDPEGIVSYSWYMGDGSYFFHGGPVVEYSYSFPGTYRASLTIINNRGYTDTATFNVAIPDTIPPRADAGNDIVVWEGGEITLDGRASSDNSPELNYTWTVAGETLLYGPVVRYMPPGPGEYQVVLKVTDSTGLWDTDGAWIRVRDNTPPRIFLDYPREVELGDTITINASSSGDNVGIENVTWDLGEGRLLFGTLVLSFPAQEAKRYFVTLHLLDHEGNWNSTTVHVDVRDVTPPYGLFKIDPTPRQLNETYIPLLDEDLSALLEGLDGVILSNTTYIFSVNETWDDTGIGTITWWFGDGYSAGGPIVYHDYKDPGLYKLRLDIKDIWGNQFNSNLTLLVIVSWNQTVNEIETILHEYVNNTVFVEPQVEEDDGPLIDLWPLVLILGITAVLLLGLYEGLILLRYKMGLFREMIYGTKEEDKGAA
ncbi:MAG: PKD domain-containing protein [Thermoplasmatota archaeon]